MGFDPFNIIEDTLKDIKGVFGGEEPAADTAAADLEAEEEAKKRARELAFGSLTQTSSTGAGSAETQKAKVLGV